MVLSAVVRDPCNVWVDVYDVWCVRVLRAWCVCVLRVCDACVCYACVLCMWCLKCGNGIDLPALAPKPKECASSRLLLLRVACCVLCIVVYVSVMRSVACVLCIVLAYAHVKLLICLCFLLRKCVVSAHVCALCRCMLMCCTLWV